VSKARIRRLLDRLGLDDLARAEVPDSDPTTLTDSELLNHCVSALRRDVRGWPDARLTAALRGKEQR
jgi:hypothetical protein